MASNEIGDLPASGETAPGNSGTYRSANLQIALRVVLRIRQSAEMLTDFPMLAPVWDEGPTRALVVSGLPYRIHYRITGDIVDIITIAHTSQRPPKLS